ncbi:hypothetical protein SAMN05216178_5629 [Pseudomonas saponiphila]|uniref:Uncharacterized protein n=1 Tax=Pseudomonas saponiphila TaxID=556534 RepID=A0A1H4WXM5_9PSED|nr:hypothetical protein SAMN05216178_5629 [Pseudomonas saponiphila]
MADGRVARRGTLKKTDAQENSKSAQDKDFNYYSLYAGRRSTLAQGAPPTFVTGRL